MEALFPVRNPKTLLVTTRLLTLHLRPTRRMKRESAALEPALVLKPILVFHTRLTRSRAGKPSNASINLRNVLSVIVVPDTADSVPAVEKSLPPMAPSDKTFKFD